MDTLDVATALAAVCQQLRAFGYVSAYGCKTVSKRPSSTAPISASAS
jgi:uncharacterized protein